MKNRVWCNITSAGIYSTEVCSCGFYVAAHIRELYTTFPVISIDRAVTTLHMDTEKYPDKPVLLFPLQTTALVEIDRMLQLLDLAVNASRMARYYPELSEGFAGSLQQDFQFWNVRGSDTKVAVLPCLQNAKSGDAVLLSSHSGKMEVCILDLPTTVTNSGSINALETELLAATVLSEIIDLHEKTQEIMDQATCTSQQHVADKLAQVYHGIKQSVAN